MTAARRGTNGHHIVVTRQSPHYGNPITTLWLGLNDQIQVFDLILKIEVHTRIHVLHFQNPKKMYFEMYSDRKGRI